MKKILLALTALTAFAGSAVAADLPARTYTKAPAVVAPVPTFTGFWISGGFGYGLMEYQHSEYQPVAPFALASQGQDVAAKGWLGKLGLGYDYQFMGNFVIGAFGDVDWTNIGGQYSYNSANLNVSQTVSVLTGQVKNDWNWAVGARVGYVALPGLLTYFNAGYTQGHFKQTNYADGNPNIGFNPNLGAYSGVSMASQTRGGYFIGGGTEYAVSQIPGLFWKNEVRFSEFGNKTNPQVCVVNNAVGGCNVGSVISNQTSHVFEQKATTELVYRFNWGSAVVAKY